MSEVAEKTDPKLWEKVKDQVTKSDKGGRPGQWSARKAQLASHEYQAEGGGYKGRKTGDNHLQQWTEEKWGTKSGRKSLESGERYLPEKAREHLTSEEYGRSTAKKRADLRKGKQFSAQPADVAHKTARDRHAGHAAPAGRERGSSPTKAQLMHEARAKDIAGRSKMSKAELEKAVG